MTPISSEPIGRSASGGKPIALVSPDLRPSVLGVARALQSARLLRVLVTGASVSRGTARWIRRLGGERVLAAARSRVVPEWLEVPTFHYGRHELPLLAAGKLGIPEETKHRIWMRAEPAFDAHVARRWAGRVPCIYGMESASVETFEAQHERGGLCVLWQVIAHRDVLARLDREERDAAAEEPADPYQLARHASQDWVDDRKNRQIALSDLIVCNSDFVRASFIEAGVPAEKLAVAKTACPRPTSEPNPGRSERPRIVLYAAHLSYRKGLVDLLDAWRRIARQPDAELWIAGPRRIPERALSDMPRGVRLLGPLPRSEVEALMKRASLFVLPTLAEGRSHAVLEALSSGLPVITTRESGCGDLVVDGETGFLVTARDVEGLAARIAFCLDRPELLETMGRRALDRARAWGEEDFQREHNEAVEELLRNRSVLRTGHGEAGVGDEPVSSPGD